MQTRRVGRSGLEVSEIALGSWLTMGSAIEMAESAKLVEHAYDVGINFFDTADVYANGAAEEVLGRALQPIPRQYVVIASKCYFPMSDRPNDRGLSRKHVCESVEASLARLRTDYLDIHQCHRADPKTPMEETVRTYEDLIGQGKLLYWGVSEWSAEQIEEACRIADATGGYRPISNQPNYSILRREIEGEILPTCEALGLGQLTFSPLGQGVLTGKYCHGKRPEGSRATDRIHGRFMGNYLEPDVLDRVAALEPLAADHGISTGQLAIAWCLRRPEVSSVIIGARRLEQIDENCAASGIALPDAVRERIDGIFAAEARVTAVS